MEKKTAYVEVGELTQTQVEDLINEVKQSFSRSPYTLACDLLRAHSETQISRSDASQIRSVIAKAIGMNDEQLAIKLAEYFTANEQEIVNKSVDRFLRTLSIEG